MLNRYIYKTNDGFELYHSITGEYLPSCSDEKTLRDHLFLSGSENESIEKFIFSKKKNLGVFLLPTMQCDFRCPHCFVKHQLLKPKSEEVSFDINKVVSFFDRYRSHYGTDEKISIRVIGGEPTIASKELGKIKTNTKASYTSITTNGDFDWSEDIETLIDDVDIVFVSLDGDRACHDRNRIPVYGKRGKSFDRVVQNVYKMIQHIGSRKVKIQASGDDSFLLDKERKKRFVALLYRLGVDDDRISIQSHIQSDLARIKRSPSYMPCCNFRFMNHLTIYGDHIYADYFNLDRSKLGKLTDSMEDIEKAHENYIRSYLPVLKDDQCMNKCNALGFCWGRCSNLKDIKPSTVCDPVQIRQKATEEKDITDHIGLNTSPS